MQRSRVILGVVIVACALAMSGCAGLQGDDKVKPTETPTPTPEETPKKSETPIETETITPTPTPEDVSEGTATSTPSEREADETVELTIDVTKPGSEAPVQDGTLRLADETGDVIDERSLSMEPSPTFDDLDPGRYLVEAVDTSYSPTARRITVTESTRQQLSVGYEFEGARSFKFEYTILRPNPMVNETHVDLGFGEIASDGDGMIAEWRAVEESIDIEVTRELNLHKWLDLNIAPSQPPFNIRPGMRVYIDNETYVRGPIDEEWKQGEGYHLATPDTLDVRDGLGVYNYTERRYLRSEMLSGAGLPDPLNGLRVDVYEIMTERRYYEDSNLELLHVFVDPKTGYIVRWKTLRELPGGRHFTLISDYYAHGEAIDITPDRFDID